MARTQSPRNLLDSDTFVTSDTPIGLTIAGSDCCAGAGIQADLRAFAAFGVYGLSAVTAVVAETPNKIERIEPLSPELVESQIKILFETYPIRVVKTGMLPSSGQIIGVARLIRSWKSASPEAKLVVDPVIVASSSIRLIDNDALQTMEDVLLPLADLITPNRGESKSLLGQSFDPGAGAVHTIEALARKYRTAIFLKGGHGGDPHRATDLLMNRDRQLTEFSTARIPGGHQLHGTGCTLSAAIAAGLAKGACLEDAIAAAKTYITACIKGAHQWPGVSALGRATAPGD